ncbi:hypothetical protein GLYMA_06G105551v4 [Glycine max]|nr:hypothetical protein GLYMA_06G105551v4 [Glycine max]KAH1125197.1 hypothetical protein GYH30_014685 [Glycine max]
MSLLFNCSLLIFCVSILNSISQELKKNCLQRS